MNLRRNANKRFWFLNNNYSILFSFINTPKQIKQNIMEDLIKVL